MESLSNNWITEKHIDFEYKKYMLLAYLQHVYDHFTENKLYPSLSELMKHYRNLLSLHENKRKFSESLPERMAAADFKNFKIVYDKIMEDDALMQEIEQIILFSLPQFEKHINEGKKIYDFIESTITVSTIGIVPLNLNEGYLFLSAKKNPEALVFEYQITLFENPEEKYRGICTHYLCSYEKTLSNSYEGIKSDLLQQRKGLPNPATYVVESSLQLPLEETFLPLAKRTLMKVVANK
jgi:hypothetical protein